MEIIHIKTHQQNNDGSCDNANIDEAEAEQTQRDWIHVVSIKEMVKKLHHITEECSIYRVSKRLHNINHIAYTPQAISIGPFHYGRQDLMAMEQLKLRFLDGYLRRVKLEVEDAFEIARDWETRARQCYAEPIDMNSHDFVKMMLVDGCFLVELMIMDDEFHGTKTELSYTLFHAISTDLHRDLIMLENQLPFFILECLFHKYWSGRSFVHFASRFFTRWYTGAWVIVNHDACPTKANHLVDLLRFYYALEDDDALEYNIQELPPTATELFEAGVKFKKATEYKHIMDIRFQDGVLKIPPLEIYDAFETYVRNLLAFEHYHIGDDKRCVIQYILFLDELISTEKDVSLLVKAKIISNNIGGNNEDISKLFNNLCNDVNNTCNFYYYSKISMALREYCKARCHRWMASLRRDYFNTPWTFLSFLGATFLIILTVMQVLYAALSYSKSK